MISVKITQIGNSLGAVLPKGVIDRLRLEKGDSVFLVETPDGYLLTPYDPDVAAQMEEAEVVMREDREALRALAK